VGGNVPSHDEVLGFVRETARRYGLAMEMDGKRRTDV
jgi:hypothetical protein